MIRLCSRKPPCSGVEKTDGQLRDHRKEGLDRELAAPGKDSRSGRAGDRDEMMRPSRDVCQVRENTGEGGPWVSV